MSYFTVTCKEGPGPKWNIFVGADRLSFPPAWV
jgi:hypothetical protein